MGRNFLVLLLVFSLVTPWPALAETSSSGGLAAWWDGLTPTQKKMVVVGAVGVVAMLASGTWMLGLGAALGDAALGGAVIGALGALITYLGWAKADLATGPTRRALSGGLLGVVPEASGIGQR